MRWTSMELAALATAAVPGLSPNGVAAVADDARDFTSAIVIDAEGNRWRIRSPQHQEAAMRLETELQVLRGFTTAIRAELPFRVPSVAGAVRRGEMRTFVYNHLPGEVLELEELAAAGSEVIGDVGRTIAAIHDLDESVVDNADLPRYSAERFRQRRLNELDQAATTGQIPSSLLRRWEHAMEEKELWNFAPAVSHGDLHEDNLLIDGDRVVAVTGWTDLHIGDPADDFAWLTATPDPAFAQAVLASYQERRRGPSDPHLMRRAALTAEFALAQWLVRGHATDNDEMVEEARGLLRQLEEDIESHGGQPIALTPMQGDESAEAQDSKPVARAGAAATVADTGEWAEAGADDHEPAVITDASADEDAGGAAEGAGGAWGPTGGEEPSGAPADPALDDDAPTGQFPAVPGPSSGGVGAPADEQDTGAIPAMVDDSEFLDHHPEEDDTPTGTISPVPERPREAPEGAHPGSGSLPIVADAESERRAKQKNFFPAQSADSARSAASADTGSHPVVSPADVAEEAGESGEAQAEAMSDAAPEAAPEAAPSEDVDPDATGRIPRIDDAALSPEDVSVEDLPEERSAGVAAEEHDAGPDQTSEAGEAGPEGDEPPSSSSDSSTRDTVYSSYPGLRPPGSGS